uniref:Striatin domain-containing protein n=1 Tax=Heterorhabditis bacteriophora TaxID=37862 RepID=A0A1I7WWG8_HETBA
MRMTTDRSNVLEVQLERMSFVEFSVVARRMPRHRARQRDWNPVETTDGARSPHVSMYQLLGCPHRSDRMLFIIQYYYLIIVSLLSSIKKSRTYFDQRLEFTRVLERQKELILRLEAEVSVRQKKCDYTTSLRNLERISDSIHEQRSIGGGLNRVDLPGNPPPYLPTAPPPYDENDSRYIIEQERVSIIWLLHGTIVLEIYGKERSSLS